MMKSTVTLRRSWPHIKIGPRLPSADKQKVTPIIDEEYYETRPSTQAIQADPPFASRKDPPHSEETRPSQTVNTYKATKNRAAAPGLSDAPSHEPIPTDLTQEKESSGGIERWYSGLTSKRKTLLRTGIIIGVLLVCIIVAVLLVVFLVILRTSSQSSTITTSSKVISASWTFDQTTADSYGIYNGALINGASYSTASISQPYLGNGRALTLSPSNQSFIVSTPFFNLAYTSFTVEAWIYSTNITGDRGIFGQCACSTCANQCIFFIIRSDRLCAGFTFNDLYGSTTIAMSTWYHIAFVFDYAAKQQILYLNGVQDATASNVQPYQGTNASTQIGAAQVSFATCYFNGYIDNVKVTTRAKSSTEILYAASVTAYYSFDLSSFNNDSGPNGLHGLSINTVVVHGRVNEAMSFPGPVSYFQAYGFYQLAYSINTKPFSVSLWLNPSVVSSSTILQITQQQSSSSCINLMGITSPTGLTGQLIVEGYGWPIIYGPFLTIDTWTHVSLTCSIANGMTLYVNGVLFGTTGTYSFSTSGYITWLQVGYNYVCSGYIPNGAYQGLVDELYVHSRELTQADVTLLANP